MQTLYSHEVLDSIADPRTLLERFFSKSAGFLYNYHEEVQLTGPETQLLDELLQKYETSVDRRYWENTYNGIDLSIHVEMLLRSLHLHVRTTMFNATKFLSYEVVPDTVRWINDDISFVVNIHDNNYTP